MIRVKKNQESTESSQVKVESKIEDSDSMKADVEEQRDSGEVGKSLSRKRIRWLGVFLLVTLMVLVGVVITLFGRQKKEPIKIGAILAKTGPIGNVGIETEQGMMLALDEINNYGGINGRKVELIVEDSESDAKKGKELFVQLEEKSKPDLYISISSSVTVPLAELAEANKVVLVGLMTTAPELTKEKEWVFRHFPTAFGEVPPVVSIIERLKLKSVGVIYLNDSFGKSVFEVLKQNLAGMEVEVKGEMFSMRDSDFNEQIAKLKKMEAIYVVGVPSHVDKLIKQLRAADFAGEIITPSSANIDSVRKLAEASGMYTAAPVIYNPEFVFAQEIKKKYEIRYDRALSHYAGNGYNIIKIMEGLLEGKEVTRESVRDVLSGGFTYYGVFGTLEVKSGEHEMNYQLFPAQIIEGEVNYLK